MVCGINDAPKYFIQYFRQTSAVQNPAVMSWFLDSLCLEKKRFPNSFLQNRLATIPLQIADGFELDSRPVKYVRSQRSYPVGGFAANGKSKNIESFRNVNDVPRFHIKPSQLPTP